MSKTREELTVEIIVSLIEKGYVTNELETINSYIDSIMKQLNKSSNEIIKENRKQD